jgi:hypothetical protein
MAVLGRQMVRACQIAVETGIYPPALGMVLIPESKYFGRIIARLAHRIASLQP